MMQTIRIRRAGYPIRHTFAEFVDRYRFLLPGILPSNRTPDCRAVTAKICSTILGNLDYQLGRTKVFLKDAHDLYLEQERDRVLTKKILTVQKVIRGWYYRRQYLQMRASTLIIQRKWRLYSSCKKYRQVSDFLRCPVMRFSLFFLSPAYHYSFFFPSSLYPSPLPFR